ncbi:MAG: MBL fold metallo-hydrolase [Clostridiales bacterium]|nr:MBL fold metallo-hydrolase [Clostridiales bacterium]
MRDFRITQIGRHVFSVLDEGNSSFYIVEGEKKAALIDTGITPGGNILPIVQKVTQKPPVLLLTHAHVDHFHHMDEFETVFMSHREFELPNTFLQNMMAGKKLELAKTHSLISGSLIDIGGNTLEVFAVPGHTPGSVVFLEKNENNLFTGDAIGSGCGVWMQVPGAVALDIYYQSLIDLQKWLILKGGRMVFRGGHSAQHFESSLIPNYNPVTMGYLGDLIDVVDKVIRGEIAGRPSNVDKIMELEPPLYASFGRAELQYMPSRIHSSIKKNGTHI